MSKEYQCFIRDASGEIPGKPNKGKWVDCEIIEGNYNKMDDFDGDGHYPMVRLKRTYWDGEKLIELMNEEKVIYKKYMRIKDTE